ncbi:hypothetical protein [Bradyrhizobium canariense]|nr:hypothetical protein [Bradyrhizobium canariense]
MPYKTIAVRFAFLLKRHELRRKFEQRDRQMMITRAKDIKNEILDILF